MMPFPTTDMPGHQLLKERVDAALDRAVEAQEVEFKGSATWDELEWGIIRHTIGIGNLRDGGLIVVGVSGRDDVWELTGLSPDDLETFDSDVIVDAFNKYISPAPHVDVVLHHRDDRQYLVFDVRGLTDIPHVCRRNGPDGSKLEQASFYHRPFGGRARTERVASAEEMRPIFQVAAENGARSIESLIRRLGVQTGASEDEATDTRRYDEELGGL